MSNNSKRPLKSVLERFEQLDATLPKRILGNTGAMLSVLGFGGILVMDEDQNEANRFVDMAVEHGINYFDVAPAYGNAEDKLGPALLPHRQQCFLACKTTNRDKKGSRNDLENSLKKLSTDHFDLYQLHSLLSIQEVEQAFGPNGAMETLVQAKKEGLVNYLGFSAHNEEAALLAMQKYDFDTILFPINYAIWFKADFGPRVIAKAREKNMGILALKGLAYASVPENNEPPYPKCWYEPIPVHENNLANLALRFIYSQCITAALPPGEPTFFPRAYEIASNITELGPEELEQLIEYAEKSTPVFTQYDKGQLE